MKKPKDVQELASRLMGAANTPLPVPQPAAAVSMAEPTPATTAVDTKEPVRAAAKQPEKPASAAQRVRKVPNRRSVSVFLRMNGQLYEEYDQEAVRRTKATGRGVTVQQVILEKLEKGSAV
jgi:hypothetical protein